MTDEREKLARNLNGVFSAAKTIVIALAALALVIILQANFGPQG